jgi:hypothetical protein
MEMSLKHIADLLRRKGLSPIVCQFGTPKLWQKVLIPLEYEQRYFLLELRCVCGKKLWKISEVEELQSSAMSESSPKA